jgi:aminomethyltransferase
LSKKQFGREIELQVKKTALYDLHKEAGAKLVQFAGYYMPIQYKGINAEHKRVRSSVGIFDVSHMGEFEISGSNAEEFLQYMTINDVKSLAINQVQYSAMCYEDGGIVDDLLVYRFQDKYMTIVNASNLEKDFLWLKDHLIDGVDLKNRSDEFSLIAVQGRKAEATLQKLTNSNLSQLEIYWLVEGSVSDIPAMIARTGYTGEDGFEVMIENKTAKHVWQAIMEAGKEFDIEPIGLGARDTLRLEVKYCLYGNDIDSTTNPLEAGLNWITKLNNDDEFIGKEVLKKVKEEGLSRRLICFELGGKAIPRHGYKIFSGEEEIGLVTSGMFSPILNKPIGLGYVLINKAKTGTQLTIAIRDRKFPAIIVKPPFYKRDY